MIFVFVESLFLSFYNT